MMFFAFSLGMVLSNLLSQKKSDDIKPVEEILFTYKGVDKTIEHVSPDKRQKLQSLASKRNDLLEQAVLEQYLLDYASAKSLDVTEAGNLLFQLKEPSQQEVNDFYTQHAEQINKPFFDVKTEIEKQLMKQMATKAKKEAIANLVERGDLVILPIY